MSNQPKVEQWALELADKIINHQAKSPVKLGRLAIARVSYHALDEARAAGWDAAVAHHQKDFAEFVAKHDAVIIRMQEDYDAVVSKKNEL